MSTDKVVADVHKCLTNMQEWLSQIVSCKSNGYGIQFSKTIATEQEFNSPPFGLRGKIDATITLAHPNPLLKQ